jgi:hypothetical protein
MHFSEEYNQMSKYIEDFKKVTYVCKGCNLEADGNTFDLPENWEYCSQEVKGKYGRYFFIPGYLCRKCYIVKRIIK